MASKHKTNLGLFSSDKEISDESSNRSSDSETSVENESESSKSKTNSIPKVGSDSDVPITPVDKIPLTRSLTNSFSKINPTYIFDKKQGALNVIDQLRDETNEDYRLFQRDLNDKGAKSFYLMRIDTARLISLRGLPTNEANLYENYEKDTPVKLFLDIDMPLEKIKLPQNTTPNDYLNYMIDNITRIIRSYLHDKYPALENRVNEDSILIMKASSDVKLSAHVVFTKLAFINPGTVKCLMINIMESLTPEMKSEFFESKEPKNKHVDFSVYGSGRCFRLLWNTKIGRTNPLVYDSYGNYYKSTCDKKLFNDSLVTFIPNDVELVKDVFPDDKIEEQLHKLNIPLPQPVIRNKPPKNCKNNINDADIYLFSPLETIQILLDMINVARADDYDSWIQLMIIVKNSNPSSQAFKIFNKWSALSDNYNSPGFTYNKWLTIYTGGVTIASLYSIAKKDNPVAYDDWRFSMDVLAFKNEPPEILHTINTNYLLDKNENITDRKSPFSKAIMEWVPLKWIKSIYKSYPTDDSSKENTFKVDYKYLILKSPYDTGKTSMLLKLLTEFEFHFKRVLFITYRQSLALDILGNFKKLRFVCYLDDVPENSPDAYESDRSIVQIESLTKFRNGSGKIPKFDLVIIDEAESSLNHFTSDTVANKEATFNFMTHIIRNSSSTILLDGDISNRAFDYIKMIAKPKDDKSKPDKYKIIYNTIQKCIKSFILTPNEAQFHEQFTEAMNANKNFIVASQSSKYADKLYDLFNKDPRYKDKVLCHTANSDDEIKKKLIDVNQYWIRYKIVIYSPTITAGVNFDTVHFDTMFVVLCAKTNNPRDLMQMLGRCRKFKNITDHDILTVWVYTNNLPLFETAIFHKFIDVFYHSIHLNRLFDKNCDITEVDGEMFENYDTIYNRVCCHNELEKLNSDQKHFIPYLLYIFRQKGHLYKFAEKPQFALEKINLENICMQKLLDAPDIPSDQINDFIIKQQCGMASTNDKYIIEKYMFKQELGIDVLTQYHFDTFYQKLTPLRNSRLLLGTQPLLVPKYKNIEFNKLVENPDKIDDGDISCMLVVNKDISMLKRHMRVNIMRDVIKEFEININDPDFHRTRYEFTVDQYRMCLRDVKKKTLLFKSIGKYCFDDIEFGDCNLSSIYKLIDYDEDFKTENITKIFKPLLSKFGIDFDLIRNKIANPNPGPRQIYVYTYTFKINGDVRKIMFKN